MIDAMMLCMYDWANTGWRFAQCLKMLGLNVYAFKGAYHPFGYPEQIPIHPDLAKYDNEWDGGRKCAMMIDLHSPMLENIAETSKIIHFRDTCFINTGVDLEKKKVVSQHGGRMYRQHHGIWNENFGYLIDKTIIQMPDILDKGAPNEALIYYPVQTNHPMLKPDFNRANHKKLVFAHYPTSQIHKGSKQFFTALNNLYQKGYRNFRFHGPTDFEEVPNWITLWNTHLDRLRHCDIVMETCSMVAQGLPFGEWGNQCLEAAAMGKIVITNTLTADLYKKEYGEGFAPRIANNEDDVERHVEELLSLSDSEIRQEKERHRAWVEKYHSMEATAQRLWDKIYKDLLG